MKEKGNSLKAFSVPWATDYQLGRNLANAPPHVISIIKIKKIKYNNFFHSKQKKVQNKTRTLKKFFQKISHPPFFYFLFPFSNFYFIFFSIGDVRFPFAETN